ncbi:MAG: CDP-alcohol phosphatidyltransferase family protein [Methanosarcinales archaeon]|nr:CDP-alcohol phosphatidyltransferase family protein [Methanosarcinales archaeon]MCK4811114.1 CDP-alcohol phosphatidyltransferase family protein [Methanosarcinales archaeon]
MSLDSLRPYAEKILKPLADTLSRAGVTPDATSVLSLIFAAGAGVLYAISCGDRTLALAAGVLVLLNGIADAMDGEIARIAGTAGIRGDFLDHVIDRYADVFIICGIFFGEYIDWRIGVAAIVGTLLTSYLGTQAQAVGLGRHYGGILGRADRLVLIMLASLLYFLYPYEIYGTSSLGWSIVLIAVASNLTTLQRFVYIWKELGE